MEKMLLTAIRFCLGTDLDRNHIKSNIRTNCFSGVKLSIKQIVISTIGMHIDIAINITMLLILIIL